MLTYFKDNFTSQALLESGAGASSSSMELEVTQESKSPLHTDQEGQEDREIPLRSSGSLERKVERICVVLWPL